MVEQLKPGLDPERTVIARYQCPGGHQWGHPDAPVDDPHILVTFPKANAIEETIKCERHGTRDDHDNLIPQIAKLINTIEADASQPGTLLYCCA